MMTEIVDLSERRPHWTGIVKCIQCRHIWCAVAPEETYELECPACHAFGEAQKVSSLTQEEYNEKRLVLLEQLVVRFFDILKDLQPPK